MRIKVGEEFIGPLPSEVFGGGPEVEPLSVLANAISTARMDGWLPPMRFELHIDDAAEYQIALSRARAPYNAFASDFDYRDVNDPTYIGEFMGVPVHQGADYSRLVRG